MVVSVLIVSCENRISYEEHEGYTIAYQSNGPALGYSNAPTLVVNGLLFKDLDRNGELTPYEDWRLSPSKRSRDLASRLSIEQICGLMVYSSAQQVKTADLSEKQKSFLENDCVRHILVAETASAGTCAKWSNNVQAFCEAAEWGIPTNNSSDPRNYTNGKANTSTYTPEPDGEFDPDGNSWDFAFGLNWKGIISDLRTAKYSLDTK